MGRRYDDDGDVNLLTMLLIVSALVLAFRLGMIMEHIQGPSAPLTIEGVDHHG